MEQAPLTIDRKVIATANDRITGDMVKTQLTEDEIRHMSYIDMIYYGELYERNLFIDASTPNPLRKEEPPVVTGKPRGRTLWFYGGENRKWKL